MKIYTLFYEDVKLFNKQTFILPNDAAAIKAMKVNLMDPNATSFKNEAKLGNTVLMSIGIFTEEDGLVDKKQEKICNLKDLLDDNNTNLERIESNNS